MIIKNFNEKISLLLSLLILNNYFFLSLNIFPIFIKINFVIFLTAIFIFYFYNFFENLYLKLFFLFIIFIALGTPTYGWDARSIWLFHAKRIFFDGSIYSVVDNYAPYSNNEYPSLAPALASSLGMMIGHWNEVFPKLSFTLIFLPPLILTYIFITKTQYLIFLSIVFFTIGKFMINGWLDGLIAIYFGLSTLLMYILIIDTNNDYKNNSLLFYITFCFFTSLTLLKDEGVALLLVLFISTFFIKFLNKNLKKYIKKLILLSLSFLPIIFWKIFCYSNGMDNHHINLDLNIMLRFYEFNNYKLISYFLFLNEKFMICLIFFLLSFALNWNKELFNFIFIVIILYVIILFLVFLSTPFDFYWQLDSTAARVVRGLNFTLALFGLYNLKERLKDI